MEDLHAHVQERPRNQVVTMAAAGIFLTAEQHGALLEGGFHEAMDSSLIPRLLAHRCVIELPANLVSVIAGGIVWTPSECVSGPPICERMSFQQRLERFPVKVRHISAIGCAPDIDDR
jgi:hypothetical protein